jgi:hypothetical protein
LTTEGTPLIKVAKSEFSFLVYTFPEARLDTFFQAYSNPVRANT